MFVEPPFYDQVAPRVGWIEAVCGSMFSGKTEELIRRLSRAELARQQVVAFKPALDTRYHAERVISHSRRAKPAVAVERAEQLIEPAAGAEVVGVDEAQFFDAALPEVCSYLADRGKRVIVAGLDMDFTGKPFGPMPALLARAEYITKMHAVCMVCGQVASYSFRLVPDAETVLLGEQEAYEARCRRCFVEGMRAHAADARFTPPARFSSR
ncbi:MAG: thymidine kinase [Catalinimonas sp.]